MLNGRGTLCIILGIVFILFLSTTELAQSQSETETIIEKIYQSETRAREHVDKKFEDVDKKFSDIDTKIGTLSTNVAINTTNITNIKETVDWIWKGILGILATLILSIAGYFLKSGWQNRGDKDNVNAVEHLADQIARGILARAEISATSDVPGHPKVPRVDELIDPIGPKHHDERRRV